MDTGLGGLLAHGAVPGTTCFGFCELCDEHMLFPLPRPVLQRAPAGQAPPQPDRVSFPVPSVPMTLSCPSCSRPCTVDASVPAPLLDSSVSSSNSNPLLPDSTATGNAPTAPSGATGSWFDALLGPVPAGVTPNEAPSPASASTATGAGAGTGVGAGAMMSLIQAALFSQLTARTPNADDDDEDDEDLPEYERAARDTLSAAAAASGGGASSRGNGLGSLLELARAQEGLSLDDIMARLSSHEDLHPASPEFMSSLRTAARLPSRGDFYQLLLAVDGLPAAMPVAAAAFGRDPYAPLLSPVSTSAASSTALVSTPELSTSSAAAEALLRKHKGGPSVETEVLASGLLQLAPDPTLASVSPAKPEQADAHPGALLALRGGISFARKAAAASRVGASCLLVCQTGAQWPYTMTDAAGEWPALAAAAGVKPTDPLLLMLRRDDAVKLAAHVAARATATAIASRITATAEGLEAALKGAYDALVAADASGARNSSGSLLAVPVEVVVLRRRRPLVCAVCQEDFVLPCERVEKAAEEENTEPVASCASESDGRDDVLTTLPCGHRFHLSCVLPWLRRQASCPLCRAEMPRKEVGKSRKARQGANADLEGYRHSMFT